MHTQFLTPSNNPTTVYKNPLDVEEFLPSTDKIQWKWRQKKEKAFALRNPTQKIEEFPALTTNKKISTKSTARRKDILIEIEEQKNTQIWKDTTENLLNSTIDYNEIKLVKHFLENKERIKQRQE